MNMPFFRAIAVAVLFNSIFGLAAARADLHGFSLGADVTYSSLYMMDGFSLGGDHPVLQPAVNLFTPWTGVFLSLWMSIQLDRGNQEWDEYDLMAWYRRDFLKDSSFAFNLHGFLDYWDCPKLMTPIDEVEGGSALEKTHGNKVHAGGSLPKLLPIFGSHLVPTYNFYYTLYWAQNQRDRFMGGAHHELMLSYYHDLPRLIPAVKGLWAGVSGTENYEDGVFGAPPGWSHTTAHLSVGLTRKDWSACVSLNRQWSHISKVNSNDALWTNLSFSKTF